ncbi:MAG: Polysaccharide pyruvyl transferase [Holophagaceae bacterium]|nr:Polysaccharide pyruvyl transferase [Holophagaceae bacterium]
MLHYCRMEPGNFGDDLNPWLWSRLAPELMAEQDPRQFIAIGTILGHSLPKDSEKYIFGAGCGYGRIPRLDSSYRFYGVRGPLTAARLKLPPSMAIGDPAVLLRQVALATPTKRYKVSFMPHHRSMDCADWAALCQNTSIHLIDPCGSVETTLAAIQESELVLAEAMHGAIVADALRVPWIPIRLYSHILKFKWMDWARSLDLEAPLIDIPPIFQTPLTGKKLIRNSIKRAFGEMRLGKEKWRRLQLGLSSEGTIDSTLRALEALAVTHHPLLSSDLAIQSCEERLQERLYALRRDWNKLR